MSDKISPRNSDGIRKVHVGCGPHAIMKDWWNIDIRKFQGVDKAVAGQPESYELVHWNNSLHHMLNVEEAVEWSWKVLKPGGLFYINDIVGPDRFQWTDTMLLEATAVRQSLPERFLVNPRNPSKLMSR